MSEPQALSCDASVPNVFSPSDCWGVAGRRERRGYRSPQLTERAFRGTIRCTPSTHLQQLPEDPADLV